MTITEKPDAPAPENAESDSGLYRALLSHYVHQDRLLWSRVQLLIAIQGAVLAGAVVKWAWKEFHLRRAAF